MSVNYLKKKKMYAILKELIVDDGSLKLNCCHYKFYRGAEWLSFYDGEYLYELYHNGSILSLDIGHYDDYDDRRISDDRLTFVYINGCLKVDYWRNGKNDLIKPGVAKMRTCAG